MKFSITPALVSLTLSLALPARADVGQIFMCHLAEGKTSENVWSTMEAFRALPRDTDSGLVAFLWEPFRSGTQYDYVWAAFQPDFKTMADGFAGYMAAPTSPAMNAQFEALGPCDSAIVFSEEVVPGAIPAGGADRDLDAVVEVFQCALRDGADRDDITAATNFWKSEFAKITSTAVKTYAADLWMPYRGGPAGGGADFLWIGAYPDLASWGQGEMDFLASKEGAAMEAKFNAISTCGADLWFGYWIMPPRQP